MSRKSKYLLSVLLLSGLAGLALLLLRIDFSFSRDCEGLYLLRGTHGKLLLSNTFYLGEEDRYLWGVDFVRAPSVAASAPGQPTLTLEWNEAAGVGYLRSDLGDGTVLVTNFSRYIDSDGRHTRGLFIGGALPAALRPGNATHQNDSGMTWFDGRDWNHLWCNTNEGITSATRREGATPAQWTFLGSRVVSRSAERIVVASRHQVVLDAVPFLIERLVTAEAGNPYLQLEIKITNRGDRPGTYNYYYGDEPWIGDFGSSAGDIGWLPDRLVDDEEYVDPRRYSWAGMVDDGSDLLHEGHQFRHVANFIEWDGPDRPDAVFFANRYNGIDHDPALHTPLFGDTRSLGVFWGPRILAPGGSRSMVLAIGMARRDLHSAVPKLPRAVSHPRLAAHGMSGQSHL